MDEQHGKFFVWSEDSIIIITSASHSLAREGFCCSFLGRYPQYAFVRQGVPEDRQGNLLEVSKEGTEFLCSKPLPVT